MNGFVPTEVAISGVLHEYSTVDGVQEDVVDILLNVKGIVFKLHGRGQVQLTLRKSGAGVVVAGDIELPHDVEILNPEHIICHLPRMVKLRWKSKLSRDVVINLFPVVVLCAMKPPDWCNPVDASFRPSVVLALKLNLHA